MGIEPTYLRCEYRVGPLGIDEKHPRLSWVPSAKGAVVRGQKQTAYQIQVASSQSLLSKGNDFLNRYISWRCCMLLWHLLLLFSTTKSEATIMKQLDAFVQSAKQNSLKTYVLGVRSISMYTIALTEGVDYLAGYALSPVARSAEDIYAFRLDMPYLSLLESIKHSSGV